MQKNGRSGHEQARADTPSAEKEIDMTDSGSTEDRWEEGDCYALGILTALAADPDRVAVHWRGREIRAGQLARSVVDMVHTLRNLNVGPGTTVAVLVTPNSPAVLSVRYATHLLGGAVTYVHGTNPGSTVPALAPEAQLRILLDSSAAVLCIDTENAARARQLAERAPGRFVVTEVGTADESGAPLDVVAELGALPDRAPHSLALVAFTSGSTGRPKGVHVPTRVWDGTVKATISLVTEPDPRLLVATPLSVTVGPAADAVLSAGGTVFLHEEFDAVRVMRAVAEHGITRTFMATPHLYQCLEVVKSEGTDLSTLRSLVYTGVAASPAKLQEAARHFGPILLQIYGSTESGRISVLLPEDHDDPELRATVGHPFPEVEVKVCDQDSQAELPRGETGEIWVRSSSVMDGYLGDPALTARVLVDGWYRTGDIGRLDEKGRLSLVDRVAEVVKTDGVKIYPAVVEREIASLEGVASAAVYGVRDTYNLEHLHAAVVLKPGEQVSAEAIRCHIGTALSPAHAPEEIRFLDDLPLGASGKPDKQRLRRLYPVN
jgi:fatty-acyl-CoA synthase